MRRRRSGWSSSTSRPSRRAVSSSRPCQRSIALPESVSDLPDAVAGVRELECDERARVGPALEEAAVVPSVDRWIDGASVPGEKRDEPGGQMAVEAADRCVDLAASKLLRGPERVVPEVARDLGERRGVGEVARLGRGRLGQHLADPEPSVVEHAEASPEDGRHARAPSLSSCTRAAAAAAGRRRPRLRRERGARPRRPRASAPET